MKFDPDKHHRRSIRLRGYDYSSSGLYFITICAYRRQYLFGKIVDGVMQLNSLGQIVETEWWKTEKIRPGWYLGAWIVMPNHVHGVVGIGQSGESDVPRNRPGNRAHGHVGAHGRAPLRRANSISSFVAGFKSATTKQINILRNAAGTPVWQRNYYDHIIRDDQSLLRIEQYIRNNPITWQKDQLHPNNPSKW